MKVLTFNLADDWRCQLRDEEIEAYDEIEDRYLEQRYIRWIKVYLRKAIESVLDGSGAPLVSAEEYRWIRLACDLVVLDGTDEGGERKRFTLELVAGGNGTHIFRLVRDR